MFSLKLFCIIFLCLVNQKFSLGDSAEKYFNLCHRSSPDFEKCIQNSIMETKPQLMKGIPEIGLLPMDPMAFPPLDFKENNRNFKIAATFKDMTSAGLSNMTVEKVKVDGDVDSGMTINLTITAPVVHSYGKWAGKGRAWGFNINGNGKYDVNFTQAEFKFSIKGASAINEKNQKKYFAVNSFEIDPVLKKAHIQVTNMFPNDKGLEKTANTFMNRNMPFILGTVKQYSVKHIGGEFEKVIKTIFDAWPIDELMLL